RVDTLGLARSLLTGRALRIDIRALEVAYAEVALERTAHGELGIVEAFEPAQPSTQPPPRPVEVTVDDLRVHHAWIHGRPDPRAAPIDADLDAIAASIEAGSRGMSLDLTNAWLATRGLEGREPAGALRARLREPKQGATAEERTATLAFDGVVGEV